MFCSRTQNSISRKGGPRGKTGGPDNPEKSQVTIVFLRNTGTHPLEKHLDAYGPL